MTVFAQNGLTAHQTHAPFNRYNHYADRHGLCLARCAEATELMGAKFMVAHGDEFDFANRTFTEEAALDYNHDLFLPFVERAEKGGYAVAFETVFEDMNRRRFTSKAEELKALITSFHSSNAVCCWDFGHAHVSFRKTAPEKILELGELIRCTHLHDNAGNDSHQLPLTGDIDWQATAAAFREIGYRGVMSIEYAHGRIPEALAKGYIDLNIGAAKHIWENAL